MMFAIFGTIIWFLVLIAAGCGALGMGSMVLITLEDERPNTEFSTRHHVYLWLISIVVLTVTIYIGPPIEID